MIELCGAIVATKRCYTKARDHPYPYPYSLPYSNPHPNPTPTLTLL